MNFFNPQSGFPRNVLATDLDGTLIPLPEQANHVRDLDILREAVTSKERTLIFATGRHLESVQAAIEEYHLPEPDWMICDVGSRTLKGQNGAWEDFDLYTRHLEEISQGCGRDVVEARLSSITGLSLQIPEHQTAFKISYECPDNMIDGIIYAVDKMLTDLPYSVTGSLDPFQHCGLIDVMPTGVSKAYALLWLSTHADFVPDNVIYAGDSGNDLSALTAGFHAIVVGNASPGLAGKVHMIQRERGMESRFFCTEQSATSGVLEGCRYWNFL